MANSRSNRLLRIIAFFKFIKAALLIATGIGALRLVNRNIYEYSTDLVARYHLNPGNHFVAHALERTTSITPKKLHELGIIAFVYSALFLSHLALWPSTRGAPSGRPEKSISIGGNATGSRLPKTPT